jgi:hypothetical protein
MPAKPLDRLMFMQGGLCFFCAQPLPKSEASVEHLVARFNGGSNQIDNCVACCVTVNALFGHMSLKEKFLVVLNQRGNFKCPNGGKIEASPQISSPPKRAGALKAMPTFDLVVANLQQRGNSRPRTLQTLTSTLASLLPKGRPQLEVEDLIKELQATGKVSILENKVTYHL